MPARGQISPAMDPRASAAQRAFAIALAELCSSITRNGSGIETHRAVCRALAAKGEGAVSEVVLSRQLHARERPRLDLAERLYALAIEVSEVLGRSQGLLTLVQLRALHSQADASSGRRRRGRARKDGASIGGFNESQAQPASTAFDAPVLADLPPNVLPVPQIEGDRQDAAQATARGTSLDFIQQIHRSGRVEDTRTALFHLGTSADIDEAAAIVSACRASGLHEAADTILHYAGARQPGDVVRFARHLVQNGAHHDAELLLVAAGRRLATTGREDSG